ncbi:MAG: hypothetical protein A2Z21_09350 [Candidatus Fraserbacteria bacterium RBG_16_55_9]|uniref:Uncharacterized protein n=1 Tax=Fraserbacteria sp. (strain RBG_16_55_9) TaxID=1817864 RepID=A0A1F5US19_FRAXR|nr:MAG: hypothetical protein A2Z21_09350 [Candidatus Fraserbacteria bacterium RBG_16_55_9]
MTHPVELVVDIVLPGVPIPKARPRLGRNGDTYTPRSTVEYELGIAWAVRQVLGAQMPDGTAEYLVRMRFYAKSRAGDIDNIAKACLDGLVRSGVVFVDDRQVTRIEAEIIRGSAEPRTEVTVWRLGGKI